MKDIFEILGDAGITVPEDKKAGFTTSFNENYKTVIEAEKLRTSRDNYKTQLETATEALKQFEGVDVSDLRSQISKLTTDLANSKAEHEKQLADRDFNDFVAETAKKHKAKDLKAVLPFLDVEKLRASKNQNADVEAAFEQVKKDKAYLFDDETAPRVVSYTSGPDSQTDTAKTKANDALRSLFGKD